LVIEAHAAEGYSFLEQHQKGNPEKNYNSIKYRNSIAHVREAEQFFILYSAAKGSYPGNCYLS
jgi:hypothetical protein